MDFRRTGLDDWAKVHATTEADIQRQAEEDESDTETLGEPRYIRRGGVEVIPPARIRRIREKLGPTQSAFAKRFGLSERTVAEWELGVVTCFISRVLGTPYS